MEVQVEGKIVGMQTEMRQGFDAVNARFDAMATKDDLSAMNARFDAMATKDDLSAMNARFDQILLVLNTLTTKPDQDK